ncbi:MAG TPA: pyridoxal phosphate-dependent aminotransferase [Longimicrobiaceae bacterium]|nr:pyridoxal phosphate-dependent aminotransferase [Longimicrobiaceae bacterium]
MIEFSPNVERLTPSATIALGARVKQLLASGADVINLTVGEPDFPTPSFVSEAGIAAIRAGHTRYTASAGIPELRAAIASDLCRLSPRAPELLASGVVVTSGAKQALFNACFCLFGPGDRVLIPAPYWTTYPAQVDLARAEPVVVWGDAGRGFKVTPEDLERAAAGGAKGLLLNSPNNPTGAVYSLEELEAIARWAAERGVWLISDEIYRRIYRGGGLAPGILDVDPALLERVVVIDGASKAFAMTGWRIGFSYSSPALAERMAALQSQTTSQAPSPSQYAALAAYTAGEATMEEYRGMNLAFERRRELVVQLFREHLPEVRFIEPEGAFYLFFSTEGLAADGEDSIALCERLLGSTGVALVPGEAFGDDHYLRLSYACSEEKLREAVRRLAEAGRA